MSEVRAAIERLREAEKAATPGPFVDDYRDVKHAHFGFRIAECTMQHPRRNHDARRIAVALNALPALLDVAEAALEAAEARAAWHNAPDRSREQMLASARCDDAASRIRTALDRLGAP